MKKPLITVLGMIACILFFGTCVLASFHEFRDQRKPLTPTSSPTVKTFAAAHPLETPTSSSNPTDDQSENPINQLLHAVKSADNTYTCHPNPKSIFTEGQFAELSLKYTPACDYWLTLGNSSSSSTSTDKANETDKKDELFRSLFVNTVTYTILEDDSDSDSAIDQKQTDHTPSNPSIPSNPSNPSNPSTPSNQPTTHHDDVHHHEYVAKPGEVAVAPPVSAPEPGLQPSQPVQHQTSPSTDEHDHDHDHDHEHDHEHEDEHEHEQEQQTLMIQFSFTSNDLDVDLPRYDREMEQLVSELSEKHGGKMKLHRKVEFSTEDVRCQREYFNKLMDEICTNDTHRTAQEKLNVIYNEQLQQRIKSLSDRQKRFESDVISRDNDRIQQRLATPSNHTSSQRNPRLSRFLRHPVN